MKIIIMGKSAAGKNHLARKMKELGLNQIVTTRRELCAPEKEMEWIIISFQKKIF